MIVTFLRHGSNAWLALGLAVLVAAFAAEGFPFSLFWLVTGALTFYVSEYGFHRFAFHTEPSRFAFIRKLQHRLHYDHHAEPDRLDLLFLPVWFLVPNLALTALGFGIIFGWSVAASAMCGVMLAIFHYEWVHYVAHIPYQPRTRIGKWIKQSFAPSLHQREVLVWRVKSFDGLYRPRLQSRDRSEAQCNHSQALRLIARWR